MIQISDEIIWPSQLLTCPSDKVLTHKTEYFDRDLYMALVDDIIDLYNTFAESEEFPQRSFAGCFLRFAGHDMLDFRYTDTGTSGGNDGCIKLDEPDNAGLAGCTQQSRIQEVYEQWCDVISLADFLVIAAEAVMGRTATNHDERDRWADNLLLQFMDGFRYGRETKDTCDGVGLMPDAEKGCNDVKDIMVDQMFRDIVMSGTKTDGADNWQAATALMGAHSLGSAKLENSGYEGHWSTIENQGVFNNNYFRSIEAKGWAPQFSVGGREDRNQWKRVDLMEGENDEMMLTSDMCLFYDQNLEFRDCMIENADNGPTRGFRQCKDLAAESINAGGTGDFLDPLETGDCCAWTWPRHQAYYFGILQPDVPADWCGMEIMNTNTPPESGPKWQMSTMKEACCGDVEYPECTSSHWAHGIGYKVVSKYAGSESQWLTHYVEAWIHATENGYTDRDTDQSTLFEMS